MGPSVGLPNRASTGGWGTAGTAGATARRLGGGGGSGGGEATRGTLKGLALLAVRWSGRGVAPRGDPEHLIARGTKFPGRPGVQARSSAAVGKKCRRVRGRAGGVGWKVGLWAAGGPTAIMSKVAEMSQLVEMSELAVIG